MDLPALESFLILVHERHYRRAAARLKITQPALSRRIQLLEESLGARLIDRSTRLVQLTAAGDCLVEHARRLLHDAERARTETLGASRGQLGPLRLGFTSMAFFRETPDIVSRFRSRYPDVDVSLRELISVEQERALLRRDIDLAFLHPPLEDPSLRCFGLVPDDLIVALPQAHRLARLRRIEIGALRDEEFILFPRAVGPNLWDSITKACREAGFSPKVAVEVLPMTTAIGLVASGLGVALVAQCLSCIKRPGLAYRPLKGLALQMPFGAAWNPEHLSPTATRFLEFVRSRHRSWSGGGGT